MDFEALRARADDIVTGAAASITTAILEVVDDVLDAAIEADEARKSKPSVVETVINFDWSGVKDGTMTPEEIARRVQETLGKVKQAKPASAAGAGGSEVDKETLVRTIYKYLSSNDSRYVYTESMMDYLVRSSFEEDRIGLVQDLLEYLGTLPPNTRPSGY